MKLLRTLYLTALSGLLTQISLAPGHIYPLSFLALIPFFIAINESKNLKSKILIGLLTGFFSNLFGFYWMVLVFKNFFFYSLNESFVLFFLFSLVGQSQFLFFSILYSYIQKNTSAFRNKHNWIQPIIIAISYSTLDYLTPKLFGDTLGNAFDNQQSLRQLSKIFGIPFLTFLCAFANSCIFVDLLNKKIKQTYLAIALILACGILGEYENSRISNILNSAKTHIKVVVIQPNIAGEDKIKVENGGEEQKNKTIDELLDMSKAAITKDKDINLIVWPETAYPSFYTNPLNKNDVQINNKLKVFVLENHIAILSGLTDRDNDFKLYNSALLVQEQDGKINSQIYHKVILAFMGEYNPFSKNTNSTLQNGDHPTLLTLRTKGKEIKISPIICYEGMSSLYMSKAKKLNPDLIIHISNEAWFGYFGLPYSFFSLVTFRSIESEIPMIKAANSGFSGLILPTGEIRFKGRLNDKETILMDVPIIQP
jgi:apolipoprotein N-acyltransferase